MKDWHAYSVDEVVRELKGSREGLSAVDAKARIASWGPNRLHGRPSESFITILFRQFHNPLIYILLASALLAVILGKETDGIVVLSVVILNTVIGFIQEYRSSETIKALLRMIPHKCIVMRDGIKQSVHSYELVPGDVVVLEPGERIAADIRLIHIKNFSCDESTLTGESEPVDKKVEPCAMDTPLVDRSCMAYSGTLVSSGTATGLVVETGVRTELGKISELLESVAPEETPLKQKLSHMAQWITWIIFFIGIGLFVVAYFRGYQMADAAMSSIALAVAAIPESLPAAITIAAAVGLQRMARRKAIIRHLLAVETLGSTTVICTDKTGTLTQNEMTVHEIWSPEGQKRELLMAAVLCNDASDPLDIALLIAARKAGIQEDHLRKEWPRKDVIPFESEKRMMATLNNQTIFLKGAPEVILIRCPKISAPLEEMTKEGMRVIAIAQKESHKTTLEEEDLADGFELLGLIGMIDPPRPEVLDAIKACLEAGVEVKMITGDHPLTAKVIGDELGLKKNTRVVLCSELDHLSEEKLREVVVDNHIFARALPIHKLKIIDALQACGHVVAMTGDGVNDAPALKKANIGISMGIAGTAVAKEASDMVLANDNFASIEAAVEEGRRVYDNLVKSIAFMFPTNLAQSLMILAAVLFFPVMNHTLLMPILPLQILWINLIVSVALSLPLAFEIMEPDVMKRAPRSPKEPLLSGFILFRTLTVALIMTGFTIALFFWQFSHDGNLAKAQTMSVTTLVFFQLFYLFNCRSLRFSILKIGFFSNPYILLGVTFVVVTQILFVHLPVLQKIFGTSSLSLEGWLISIVTALVILPIIAVEKRMLNR